MLTLMATPLLRRMLARARVLDHPNHLHKAHACAVPALGGTAVALAAVAAVWQAGIGPQWGPAVYVAIVVVFVTGVLDDVWRLSPWQKLGLELLCAAAVCAAGVIVPAGPLWLAAPLTVFWLAACANGFNLTDGADGVAALTGAIAAAGLGWLAYSSGMEGAATVLAALAAALAGFLVFNFPPASIFLGDSGSLPLGFVLGTCALVWAMQAESAVAAFAPVFALALPLGETVLSTVRRALRGDPIFRADRRHIHHRLAERGLRPGEVALWCGAYTLLGVLTAIAVARSSASGASALAALVFAGVTLLGLRFLRYAELSCAAAILFRMRGPWALPQEIRTAELRDALDSAIDAEQRWQSLVEGMRELGFREVRLLGRDGSMLRQSAAASRGGLVWKLTVDLPDGEGVLEAVRSPQDDGDAMVSDALVQTLRRALAQGAPAPNPVVERRPSDASQTP